MKFEFIDAAELLKKKFGPPPPYTEGPWVYEEQHPEAEFTIIGEPIAVVGGEQLEEPIEFLVGRTSDFGPQGANITRANARLIATAPQLLKACQAALDHCSNPDVAQQLREAIDRAEGGC